MASFTYPVKFPEGELTTEQIHLLLSDPTVIATRVADLTRQRFIGDYLLEGRFDAAGGGIFYSTGEELFAKDHVEAVAPGAEYPKTVMDEGEIAAAKVSKWGIGTEITDEKIKRQGITVVNRALARLGNTVVRDVDAMAMSVIASKVTSEYASPAQWETAGAAVEALLTIQGERADLATGIDLETVVLKPSQWAKLIGMFVDDKALPRETANIVLTGSLPVNAYGLTWVTSPQWKQDSPIMVDRSQLGGMADEKIGSPGYVSVGGFGVEASTNRLQSRDAYEVNARRVVVPVVLEPMAGVTLTGTGL